MCEWAWVTYGCGCVALTNITEKEKGKRCDHYPFCQSKAVRGKDEKTAVYSCDECLKADKSEAKES
jgi:hypothetical protein